MQSSSSTTQPRTTSDADKRITRDKKPEPSQQASAIEKSVTHLLVATKQLLETLTQWSRGSASETAVSDVYVRLGYEFNIACRAFTSVGIDTADLGNVPDVLRVILEATLSQEASQASLDQYLPRIRDIIINLLHGLKRKQQKLRQRSTRESNALPERRQASLASTTTTTSDDSLQRRELQDPQAPPAFPSEPDRSSQLSQFQQPPASGNVSPKRQDSAGRTSYATRPDPPAPAPQNPLPQPPSRQDPIPTISEPPNQPPVRPPRPPSVDLDITAPRPPKQQDALAALQRGGDLERRASRRFSAYQIQKHLGTSTAGVPMIPPAQRSPIPNRGRDLRESINAVRSRGSTREQPKANDAPAEPAPEPVTSVRDALRDTPVTGPDAPRFAPPTDQPPLDSPNAKTPEDKYAAQGSFFRADDRESDDLSATMTRPWQDPYLSSSPMTPQVGPATPPPPMEKAPETVPAEISTGKPKETVDPRASLKVETAPLTLFLQYKTKVKKFVLSGGFRELSVARLQLAFIEKFAWNTHSNGVDLPEIYVQDQLSGVRHELEDLNDVKDHSVLVLNVDNVDEVKRHFDENLGGLKDVLESVKSAVSDQQAALQRVTEKQQDAARDLARVAAGPPSSSARVQDTIKPGTIASARAGLANARPLSEIQALRRELAVMRQTYSNHMSDLESAMTNLKAKAAHVKTAAIRATVPSIEGESGRAYVNSGKKQLSDDSEKIINRVDTLQDVVEELRKDVVTRGVRPLPRQLEAVGRDISSATTELRRLREYLTREKPIWSKVMENELKIICDDQELLKVQEELGADLEDDLEKAAETFALVEQATKQQNVQNGGATGSRNASRTVAPPADVDPLKAKDTLLGEVRALQPNHETRLEAIERAERARQLELVSRGDNAFKLELGTFVEDNRLKKTGGVEEAERQRKARDERARKENWERMQARAMGLDVEAMAAAQDAPNGEQLEVPEPDDTGGSVSPSAEHDVFVEAPEEGAGAFDEHDGVNGEQQ